MVTHSGVGGGTDITARMMMVHAPGVFKNEFVVVNRIGGSGAAMDTLQYMLDERRSPSRSSRRRTCSPSCAARREVQVRGPAARRATEDPQVLAVGKGSPFKTAQDLIGAGKGQGAKYGTSLVGSVDHIAVVSIARSASMQPPTIVPFRGGGDVVINLVGGNIDCALVNYAEAESQIKAGDMRPLAIFADNRLAALPNVPTGKEVGVDGYHSTVRSLVASRSTPPSGSRRSRKGW